VCWPMLLLLLSPVARREEVVQLVAVRRLLGSGDG